MKANNEISQSDQGFHFILHIYDPEMYILYWRRPNHMVSWRGMIPDLAVRACVWSNLSFPVARIIYKKEIYKNDKCDQCLAMLIFTNLWADSADDILK